MKSFIRPRWRKPAWTVLAGAVFAAAWAIRGGQHWWLWVSLVAIATAGRAFAFWWPFAAVLGTLGLGYLLGLSSYGIAEESPADDEEAQPQAPAPAAR